mgnify:CR=1 FL=1
MPSLRSRRRTGRVCFLLYTVLRRLATGNGGKFLFFLDFQIFTAERLHLAAEFVIMSCIVEK